MNNKLKDLLIHSGADMGMMVVLLLLPHYVAVTLAVIMAWLIWETGQWVVVD
jgi:hypothetical protein